jgi:hypothetical protein
MHAQEHSNFREGLVTGLIGAIVVMAWHLIMDTAAGQPFRTPNVLGKVFVGGNLSPARQIVPAAVLGYSVLHLITFALMGMGLTFLVHLAARNLSLRMGVYLGLLIALLWSIGHVYMLEVATGERLPLWSVIGGGLLGVLGMAGYLWRRHPRFARSFDEVALGAEVEPPPHPPGGPRAA